MVKVRKSIILKGTIVFVINESEIFESGVFFELEDSHLANYYRDYLLEKNEKDERKKEVFTKYTEVCVFEDGEVFYPWDRIQSAGKMENFKILIADPGIKEIASNFNMKEYSVPGDDESELPNVGVKVTALMKYMGDSHPFVFLVGIDQYFMKDYFNNIITGTKQMLITLLYKEGKFYEIKNGGMGKDVSKGVVTNKEWYNSKEKAEI